MTFILVITGKASARNASLSLLTELLSVIELSLPDCQPVQHYYAPTHLTCIVK